MCLFASRRIYQIIKMLFTTYLPVALVVVCAEAGLLRSRQIQLQNALQAAKLQAKQSMGSGTTPYNSMAPSATPGSVTSGSNVPSSSVPVPATVTAAPSVPTPPAGPDIVSSTSGPATLGTLPASGPDSEQAFTMTEAPAGRPAGTVVGGTTTPASNDAIVTTVANRPACSGGSGKTCNIKGGPGLSRQPNIVFFLADDLGHADLSYASGNLQTPTPNIDKLAWDGIAFSRHYCNPICTPTRSALMTGKYTFRIGMQTAAISDGEPWGVPVEFKMFPQYMKDLGYDTWGVGKWHLGQSVRAFFPSSRGFDQTYMLMSGDGNWFNYTTGWITPFPVAGKMLRENGKIVFANVTNNAFLPELFTNHAEKWIRNANPNNPFFLYFATTVPHTAFEDYGAVIHTMPQYQLRPSAISFTDKYPSRKKYLANIQLLDEQFKRITDALTYKSLINNTIIVFFADNGAPIPPSYQFVHGSNHGSNWPLRQGKGVMFEGGVRTNGFIWSPLLPKRGRITSQLFHVTDWLPTMYEAAGGDVNQLGDKPGDLSGISQWNSLYNGLNYGPRTELVNNIDGTNNQYAMIYQDTYGGLYKLIGGEIFDNSFLGWYRTPGTSDNDPQTVWTPLAVDCVFPPGVEVSKCAPHLSDCLFDLVNDPCELNNIAASYPSMLKTLKDKIAVYNTTFFPSRKVSYDPASDPGKYWDGIWVPWKDPVEVIDNPPLTFLPFNPSSSY
ncbi:arylsulfatase B-like [Paramacrobiotus metropolitanus]|uniref:arylsulfatase B-like n=1 Tax=Paramacrobiotus metropolitanus TaxID=2943436 RepID=UPI0024458682|nr:arylsulfatase B-like [Paramacrobiotus metropolitanus]